MHWPQKLGFKVRASEPLHQDDWGKHREGPRKSPGVPRKLLRIVTKVTKVTNKKSYWVRGGPRRANSKQINKNHNK